MWIFLAVPLVGFGYLLACFGGFYAVDHPYGNRRYAGYALSALGYAMGIAGFCVPIVGIIVLTGRLTP